MKIKVCGMKYPDNIASVAELCPDYFGFIFYAKSKRYVGESFDASILESLPQTIKKVGVFVNASVSEVLEVVAMYKLDLVQLHGDETVETCQELFNNGIKIIKVFQIDSTFKFEVCYPYKAFVSYFLFDTKSDLYGGTGRKYDWRLLEGYDNEMPLFLSGGIALEDVEEIRKMQGFNIHALDINSKFESSPGMKDKEKLKAFIGQIRDELYS